MQGGRGMLIKDPRGSWGGVPREGRARASRRDSRRPLRERVAGRTELPCGVGLSAGKEDARGVGLGCGGKQGRTVAVADVRAQVG